MSRKNVGTPRVRMDPCGDRGAEPPRLVLRGMQALSVVWRRGWRGFVGFALVCLLLTVTGGPAGAESTWRAIGPNGGVIRALATNPTTPTTLYAGAGGVFKSPDGGATWQANSSGQPSSLPVNAIAINPGSPTTLYAWTSGAGVFKSVNGGTTWEANNNGLTSTRVTALAINPVTPTTLYAATDGGGVLKSTDGGATWQATSSGLWSLEVLSLDMNSFL